MEHPLHGHQHGILLSPTVGQAAGLERIRAARSTNVLPLDFLNPEAESQATTTDGATNTSRHAAMLFANDNIILGFEDLNRVNRSANAYRYIG